MPQYQENRIGIRPYADVENAVESTFNRIAREEGLRSGDMKKREEILQRTYEELGIKTNTNSGRHYT